MEALKALNISKIYHQNTVSLQALRNVSLEIQKGETAVILGRSGSGKSTLLNILAGLDDPTEGKVFIDGADLSGMREEQKTMIRREKIGFIFQAYELLPALRIIDNIRLPQLKPDAAYVKELLNELEIAEYEQFYPDQLSGGQQQRAAIARALVNRPPILFADEPTGNLDSKTERTVVGLLKKMALKYGTSIVLVTHNERLKKEADRIIRLEDGEIIQNDETAHAHGTIQNNEVRMVIDRWTAENF